MDMYVENVKTFEDLPDTKSDTKSGLYRKLSTRKKWYIAIGVLVAVLAIAAASFTYIYISHKNSSKPVTTPTLVSPTVTNVPNSERDFSLYDSTTTCFSMYGLPPKVQGDANCTANPGTWVEDETFKTVSYNTDSTFYCIQVPDGSGESLFGNTGATNCRGVSLTQDSEIKYNDLCVNNNSGTLSWGPCATAFKFTINYF